MAESSAGLDAAFRQRIELTRRRFAAASAGPGLVETGRVERVGDGVALLSGLPGVRLDELLVLAGGQRAMVVGLARDTVQAVLLDRVAELAAGSPARRTGEVARVPTGDGLLGRVVDPLGRPLDGGGAIAGEALPVERPAPAILDRELVTEPMHTGVLAVDAMIPLGRGQRTLIVGDRSTGKTAVAVDTILSQRDSDVVSVYCAIGQKANSVARVIDVIRREGPWQRSVVIVAEADDAPGLQWLAPYAACTIAEHWRDRGGHALLVLDDLTRHAMVHRQISLLLRDPPGREAYPGDVFYLHARLLERGAKLAEAKGGGSLTALPIAETQAGNLSAYIPTNLISITDGQIYLEPRLFNEGQKPAINTGLSVSRVGGKTQPQVLRRLAASLRLDYAQFLELESFSRFGQATDERTRQVLERGRRIRMVLRQPQSRPRSLAVQAALLLALTEGLLDRVPFDRLGAFETEVAATLDAALTEEAARIEAGGVLNDADRACLLRWLGARVDGAAAAPPVD